MRSLSTFRRQGFFQRLLRVLAAFAAVCALDVGATNGSNGRPKPVSKYLVEEWGSEKGFPGGTINALAQTRDGYLWVGAQKGLVRFDGRDFRLFSQASSTRPIGPVLGLVADGEGNLWVRLQGPGLLRYRDGEFEDFTNTFNIPEVAVTQMCRGADGRAIFATILNGLVAYDHGKFDTVAGAPSLSNFIVTSVSPAGDGANWLGTRDAGLFQFRDGKISARHDILAGQQINVLLSAGTEELWVGTDKGLLLWNGHKIRQIGPDPRFRERQILSLSKDGNGSIWVGTDRGLYRLDAESDFAPQEENTEGNGPVSSILTDREGNIWTATPRGLQRLRNSIFTSYDVSDGLPQESNGPVHLDTDGRIWFAPIQGGLYWLKDGKVEAILEAGLHKDVVYSIAGGRGDLWIGRQSGGLTHLQNIAGKWRGITYTRKDGLAQDSVYTVRLSHDGAVWAGTLSAGLTRIKSGRFDTFTTERGLISNTIASILESRNGTMWFATSRGLSAFFNNHWVSYSSRDGLPSDDVNCLFEDSAGTLWIGTMNGLAALRSGKIGVPAQGPDVLREPIFGLQVDDNKSLWISTSNHIVMTNTEELVRPDFNGANLRQFGLADGLRSTDGVKRDEAVSSDGSGKVWFSLNRGLSVVDAERLRTESPPSILHLEGLFVDGSPVSLQGPARIAPNPRRITINYAGISLSVPDRVRFKYKLDGFDKTWSDAFAAREVNYTNLNPGSYVFRVIASNSEGIWNGTALTVPLTVEQVFWRTWWFRLATLLVVMLLVLTVIRLRILSLTRQLNIRFEERLAERTRISRDLHDTLLQNFQGLLLRFQSVSALLPNRPQDAKLRLDDAIDQAAQAITEGRDAVQGLRSSTIVTTDLAAALSAIGEGMAADCTNHPAMFDVEVEGAPRELQDIPRDEVYRIAVEALRNAFRHAQARRIEVEIHYDERQLRVRVRDDGKGVDPRTLDDKDRAGRLGLRGMHERAKLLGANLDVWSKPSSGTEIELTVPASKVYASSGTRRGWWFSRKQTARKSLGQLP